MSARKPPVRPNEMAGVTVRIVLQIVLMFRLGFPKSTGRRDFSHHFTGPNPRRIDISTLLEAPYFADAVREGEAAWRRIVAAAALSGVPVPGFGAALSYYDSLASKRLPAALVQGQRDFFGAHTYKRVDKEGIFHTLWSGDRTEIETEGSSH